MPTTLTEMPQEPQPFPATEDHYRPLYLRRVPEPVWILIHDNAIRSRMRLQDYLVKILEQCRPFPQ
jgi:hypothetical protein